MKCGDKRLGWVVGESTPLRSLVIFDRHVSPPPHAGSYVVAETQEGCVLGILENVYSGHRMLTSSVTDPETVDTVSQWMGEEDEDLYERGVVRWLSLLEPLRREGKIVSPKTPVFPGSEIRSASSKELASIFAEDRRGWVRLGRIPGNGGVEFRINVNSLTRHLAILAVTGGGKSNTVCVLARRIVGGLNGTMVVFDMHGEYQGVLEGRETVHSPARINPQMLTYHELAALMEVPENAHNQRRYLRWAWKAVLYLRSAGYIGVGEMIETLRSLLENLPTYAKYFNSKRAKPLQQQGDPGDLSLLFQRLADKGLNPPRITSEESLAGILNRVEDFVEFYSDVLDPHISTSLADVIPPGRLTVFDLSTVDEQSADAIVSHYLRRILQARKNQKRGGGGEKYPVPLFLVIEEAHVLVPRDRRTLTKYWAGRIAREGRRFGVGLILVSQRPKNVDEDVLSQTNNKIILRIVEPEDIRYVQRASEELSDDIAQLLPGLNPGEAVVTGKMAKLPGLVQIDKCEGKKAGGDIDVVGEWERYTSSGDDIDVDAYL